MGPESQPPGWSEADRGQGHRLLDGMEWTGRQGVGKVVEKVSTFSTHGWIYTWRPIQTLRHTRTHGDMKTDTGTFNRDRQGHRGDLNPGPSESKPSLFLLLSIRP